jgi:hypothetical protein
LFFTGICSPSEVNTSTGSRLETLLYTRRPIKATTIIDAKQVRYTTGLTFVPPETKTVKYIVIKKNPNEPRMKYDRDFLYRISVRGIAMIASSVVRV